MLSRIEQDHGRFRQIVKGTIRKDLRRFISKGELIAREGKRLVSIPVHDVDIPTFRYGDNREGVGQGDGPGDDNAQGQGQGQGGEQAGRHILEVDVALDELADILGEELQLPRIEPKGHHQITATKDRYSGIRPVGPAGLRHFKRTYREALKRQVSMGLYDPLAPIVVPLKQDMRFRSWNEVKSPQSNAAIIYMMDVSGSMGVEQKELVRLAAFWIDTWLHRNYKGVQTRFVVHDITATQVDRATFFAVREDGGTRISSALELADKLVTEAFDPSEWNTYLFHFSDGDNSSDADNRLCVDLLRDKLLPRVNQFGYVQVKSSYGSGQFYNVLREAFPGSAGPLPDSGPAASPGANPSASSSAGTTDEQKLVATRLDDKAEVLDCLRALFKAGR